MLPVPAWILKRELPPHQPRLGERMPVWLEEGVVLKRGSVRGQAAVGVSGDCVVRTVGGPVQSQVPSALP
ncbi:hypothetical protein [Streptomyces sp. YIM S03343]